MEWKIQVNKYIYNLIINFFNFTYMYLYALLSLFSVVHMYMCLGQTTWGWITYRGVHYSTYVCLLNITFYKYYIVLLKIYRSK